MGVWHQGPVNRKKYRGRTWESIDSVQQAASDDGQKMIPWTSMDTPYPNTDSGSSTVGGTTNRGNGRRRVHGRAIMITHTKTMKRDGKACLYG
jgi:hypothetical protein